VEAQHRVLDDDARPDALKQLALGRHAARLLDQGQQQVERAAADFHRNVVAGQQPLAGGEDEAVEGQALVLLVEVRGRITQRPGATLQGGRGPMHDDQLRNRGASRRSLR
jgi:hypothetical protein